MNTAVAAKKHEASDAVAIDRRTPEIDPARVQVNTDGHVFRTMFIRLPADFRVDDLKDVACWRKVQMNGRIALRKYDVVTLAAYDESWIAEAVVAMADNRTVQLAKPRVTTFGERFEKLFSDENYVVEWMGSGYVVLRRSDRARIGEPWPSAELAERSLIQQYARQG